MVKTASRPIVIGVDGSPPSYRALDWALAEARVRRAPLRLVHATAGDPAAGDAGLATAEETMAKAAAYARAAAPGVEVTAETVRGEPAGVLVAESYASAMVVLGDRGLGGFHGLLAGSVAGQVTAHAYGPVVVVRPRPGSTVEHGERGVVVGVDGSTLSEPAVEFAFAEAAARGVGVTAVHAWPYPLMPNPSDMTAALALRTDLVEAENELLARWLEPVEKRYPGVPVCRVLVPSAHPAAALIGRSADAALLVVGSRGRGGFAGLLLGSVSHAAIHHADCPVAVVPPVRARGARDAVAGGPMTPSTVAGRTARPLGTLGPGAIWRERASLKTTKEVPMSTYRIVVGVDGSDDGNRALEWAAREAERRGGTVQAVTAWNWDGIEAGMVAATIPREERARAEQALAHSVGAIRTRYPDVTIASETIEGEPARVLTRAARDADMLVLGSHGHGRFYHAILGSVAHECIRAATCPVLIVPVPHTQRTPNPAELQKTQA